MVNNLDVSLSHVINLESKPKVNHDINHNSKAAGADIGLVDRLGDEECLGGSGHGFPHGGSKVVVAMIPIMIMNANSDSHRDSAPAPDNARSQHTASLQQVIITILGATAILFFSNDFHACIIFESGSPNREQEYAPSRPTKSPKNTFLIDPR
ncbi:hypothetical protein Tco_1458898 [Tanacetum coccineum]